MLSFKEHPTAYGDFAKSYSNLAEGLKFLARSLRDGSWREAPATWIEHFQWFGFWKPETLSAAVEIRSRLIETIIAGNLEDDAAHAVLPGVFNTWWAASFPASEIAAWLVKHAGPNDATMIADIVQHIISSKNEEFSKDSLPLVQWLVTNGSRELRSGRRSLLVADLLPLVVRHGTDEELESTIRYVLCNDNKVGTDAWGAQTVEKLLPAIERILARTGARAIIGDLIDAVDTRTAEACVQSVLQDWAKFPLSRAEIVRRLGQAELRTTQMSAIWGLVVRGPLVAFELSSQVVAREAAEGLFFGNSPHMNPGQMPSDAKAGRDWAYSIGREFLRVSDVLSTREEKDLRLLQRCVGLDEAVTEGIYGAVAEAVEHSGDSSLAECRAMLDSPGTTDLVVHPALGLLIGAAPSSRSIGKLRDLDHVLEAIQYAVREGGPTVSGFNFKEVLGETDRVELCDLPDNRAFVVEGSTLKLSRADISGACRVADDPDAQRALGVLYALHEIIHSFQQTAGMGRVAEVRFAGAESALMHIDLGADHIAAVVASSIFNWDLLELKEWEGQAIRGFAAGPRNPPYSRFRKTLRLVGLRTDLALRRLGVGADHLASQESYGFADFSLGGGPFIAMVNRPPFIVVHSGTISEADVRVFFEGIEGRDGAIERMDAIIERVLTRPAERP